MWKILFPFVACFVHITSSTVIRIRGGRISGLTSDGNVTSFLGIRYANPPTGNFRFKKSDTNVSWEGVFNASRFGPACMQNRKKEKMETLEMSEDCLFLNVFVPDVIDRNNSELFPVLVIVHPGNFQDGSGADVDGKSIAVSNHVIVVTFNYRLGVFGFLSLDGTYSGNAGLLDQVSVLNWVKENIANFNGNPNNIILLCDHFTALLYISSIFNNLFDKIISYDTQYFTASRDIGASNSFLTSPYVKTMCSSSVQNVPQCLIKLDSNSLLNASANSLSTWKLPPFWPVFDGIYFHRVPDFVNSGESASPFVDFVIMDLSFINPDHRVSDDCDKSDFEEINRQTSELILNHSVDENANILMMKSLKSLYYSNVKHNRCLGGVDLISDYSWVNTLSLANAYSTKSLTFLATTKLPGIPNTTDLDLLCVLRNCSSSVGPIHHMLYQFIRYGYPTSKNGRILWRPYTEKSKNYLSIGDVRTESGDVNTWPFERVEMIWTDFLPSLAAKLTQKDGDAGQGRNSITTCITSYAEDHWGLSQEGLEALLFSLILSGLFLLFVTATLLRIVCHFKGRTFYKAGRRKDIKKISDMANKQTDVHNNHNGTQNHATSDDLCMSPRGIHHIT